MNAAALGSCEPGDLARAFAPSDGGAGPTFLGVVICTAAFDKKMLFGEQYRVDEQIMSKLFSRSAASVIVWSIHSMPNLRVLSARGTRDLPRG